MNIVSLLSKIAPSIFSVIDQAVEDKDMATKLKHELSSQMLDSNGTIARAGADVVMAEASGESWLQRNWRPLLMIWFSILIGGYWFGFVPVNMPIEVVQSLFDLVTLGVGGYVIGRSGEKIVRSVAPLMAERAGRKGP